MGSRYEVEITITSAKDLKNVNWRHGKLKPYAVVWVDPDKKCSTRVDDDGDTSPCWNYKLTIPFNSPIEDSTLHVDIVHAGAADDTKPLIGSAKLPLSDVGLGTRAEKSLELKRPSGRPQGKVEVSVSVRDLRYPAPDPYYAPPHGVPPPGTRDFSAPSYVNSYGAYGAPPSGYPAYGAPPSGYPAYGAPPSGHPAYGAPPSGYQAYGAPPSTGQGGYYEQQGYVEETKKSKFGGMGTGLAVGAVAGVLGGLALAEGVDALEDHIADEAADRVEDDLGYDGDDF